MSSKQKQVQHEFWDDFRSTYTQQENILAMFGLALLNMLNIDKVDSILDAGCGSGYMIPYIVQRKREDAGLYAVDFSLQMVENSLKNLNNNKSQYRNVQIQQGDIENLPFRDNSFDVYFSNLVFHLLDDPIVALKESYRVLKEGGRMGISVWGTKEKCDYVTLFYDVLQELGVERQSGFDCFMMNDLIYVKKILQSIGYLDIMMWYQHNAYNIYNENDYLRMLNSKSKEFLKELPPEVQERFIKILGQKIEEKVKVQGEPILFECLMIVAKKQ